MRKYFHLLAVLVLFVFSGMSLAQEKTTVPGGTTLPKGSYTRVKSKIPSNGNSGNELRDLELPCTSKGEEVIRHTGYSLLYDVHHKQARWVAYELTVEETVSKVKRKDKFIPDPLVSEGSASNSDYANSGYDRGHLAPAADMCYSEATMAESFYLSNMSPQKPGFNRGIWKQLEALVRDWAIMDSAIYIVTGGVLQDSLPTIGTNGVSIPGYYYKVILDYHEPVKKGIGFVLPNEKSNAPLERFAVTIDSVESLTGLNFFCRLPDDAENRLESRLDTSLWNFGVSAAGDDSPD